MTVFPSFPGILRFGNFIWFVEICNKKSLRQFTWKIWTRPPGTRNSAMPTSKPSVDFTNFILRNKDTFRFETFYKQFPLQSRWYLNGFVPFSTPLSCVRAKDELKPWSPVGPAPLVGRQNHNNVMASSSQIFLYCNRTLVDLAGSLDALVSFKKPLATWRPPYYGLVMYVFICVARCFLGPPIPLLRIAGRFNFTTRRRFNTFNLK